MLPVLLFVVAQSAQTWLGMQEEPCEGKKQIVCDRLPHCKMQDGECIKDTSADIERPGKIAKKGSTKFEKEEFVMCHTHFANDPNTCEGVPEILKCAACVCSALGYHKTHEWEPENSKHSCEPWEEFTRDLPKLRASLEAAKAKKNTPSEDEKQQAYDESAFDSFDEETKTHQPLSSGECCFGFTVSENKQTCEEDLIDCSNPKMKCDQQFCTQNQDVCTRHPYYGEACSFKLGDITRYGKINYKGCDHNDNVEWTEAEDEAAKQWPQNDDAKACLAHRTDRAILLRKKKLQRKKKLEGNAHKKL